MRGTFPTKPIQQTKSVVKIRCGQVTMTVLAVSAEADDASVLLVPSLGVEDLPVLVKTMEIQHCSADVDG
jgi:hypothetical protein